MVDLGGAGAGVVCLEVVVESKDESQRKESLILCRAGTCVYNTTIMRAKRR